MGPCAELEGICDARGAAGCVLMRHVHAAYRSVLSAVFRRFPRLGTLPVPRSVRLGMQ